MTLKNFSTLSVAKTDRMNRAGIYLARTLPFTYPTLCDKESQILRTRKNNGSPGQSPFGTYLS